MSLMAGQTIREVAPLSPMCERTKEQGASYGIGPSGYDIRLAQDLTLEPEDFKLASALEYFQMPKNAAGVVHDKSTWIRLGIAVHNTVIEPGWKGYLTLELKNQHRFGFWRRVARGIGDSLRWTASLIDRPHPRAVSLKAGAPIAQILFHMTDKPVEQPYDGKYQDQQAGPQPAILEGR